GPAHSPPPSFHSCLHNLDLHSLPTRRSSDLLKTGTCVSHLNQDHARRADIGKLATRSRLYPAAVFYGIPEQLVNSQAEFFAELLDRKSTRLNSSHRTISYAVFCLNKISHPYP